MSPPTPYKPWLVPLLCVILTCKWLMFYKKYYRPTVAQLKINEAKWCLESKMVWEETANSLLHESASSTNILFRLEPYIKISTGIIHAQTLHPHQGCRPYKMWFSTFYSLYLNIAKMLTAVITETCCDPQPSLVNNLTRRIFSGCCVKQSAGLILMTWCNLGSLSSVLELKVWRNPLLFQAFCSNFILVRKSNPRNLN